MYDNAAASGAPTTVHRGGELVAASQTRSGGQHRSTFALAQADRRPRPLARRAERIARPARVRIRNRKPWVFARRRLFGWKVRLLTSGTPSSCCPSHMADGRVVRLAGGRCERVLPAFVSVHCAGCRPTDSAPQSITRLSDVRQTGSRRSKSMACCGSSAWFAVRIHSDPSTHPE